MKLKYWYNLGIGFLFSIISVISYPFVKYRNILLRFALIVLAVFLLTQMLQYLGGPTTQISCETAHQCEKIADAQKELLWYGIWLSMGIAFVLVGIYHVLKYPKPKHGD